VEHDLLEKFSYKASERQKANRKAYVADTGLRNASSFRFSQDLGRLAENVVALQLLGQARELFYFGNGSACDFIVKRKNKFLPVQVSQRGRAATKKINRRKQSKQRGQRLGISL
jgi:predicted AAA+ superfamily ATPase